MIERQLDINTAIFKNLEGTLGKIRANLKVIREKIIAKKMRRDIYRNAIIDTGKMRFDMM